MHRSFLLPFTCLTILFSAGCAGESHVLRLGQVSPGLTRLEGSPYDALVTEPVHYTVIGMPEYDRFFEESAAAYGSVLLAMKTVDRAQDLIDGKSRPTPLDFMLWFTLLRDTLPRTLQRAAYLENEGRRLREKAPSDFTWHFYKLWQVRSAVKQAQANLEATQRLAPVLMQRLHGLMNSAEQKTPFIQGF